MRFNGILLDLDNTLYDYDSAHGNAMSSVMNRLQDLTGKDANFLTGHFKIARAHVNRTLASTAASHNRLLYFQLLCERIGLNSLSHSLGLYNWYWDSFLDGMVLEPGVIEFLEATKGKVCLVTDLTAHIQYRKVERLKLDRWIHYVVTSEEVGRDKPDAAMFESGMQKLGSQPRSSCMIGDSLAKDIEGARALGIEAYWFNRDGDALPADPGIHSFRRFASLSEMLCRS